MLEFFNFIVDTSTYRLEWKSLFTWNSIKAQNFDYYLFIIPYCLKWLPLLNSFYTNNSLKEALLTIFSFQKLSLQSSRKYDSQLPMYSEVLNKWAGRITTKDYS